MNSPTPGAPQTAHKAWVGALAAIASAVVTWAATGAVPEPDQIAAWGATLGSAAAVWLAVYLIPNKAK